MKYVHKGFQEKLNVSITFIFTKILHSFLSSVFVFGKDAQNEKTILIIQWKYIQYEQVNNQHVTVSQIELSGSNALLWNLQLNSITFVISTIWKFCRDIEGESLHAVIFRRILRVNFLKHQGWKPSHPPGFIITKNLITNLLSIQWNKFGFLFPVWNDKLLIIIGNLAPNTRSLKIIVTALLGKRK